MVGDYRISKLILPDEVEYEIERFALMHRNYLKNRRKALFSIMLMNGKLNEHLFEIDNIANDRFYLIIKNACPV